MTYIALLRAINVGGHTIKMEKLREHFTELGFTNVRTYIQTGNVFFESDEKDRTVLTTQIETYLLEKLGYEVPTILRTVEELEKALLPNPFEGITVTDDIRLYILFLSKSLPDELTVPFSSPKGDFTIIKKTPGEAFVVLKVSDKGPGNFGAVLERLYNIKATSRFYHTCLKILEAAKA